MIVEVKDDRYDLRRPADRDRCVRALWRKLRPGEPEPLTAPQFANDGDAWGLCADGFDGGGTVWFAEEWNDEDAGSTYVAVPALASLATTCPACDGDGGDGGKCATCGGCGDNLDPETLLLALAEVAKAVLGSGT